MVSQFFNLLGDVYHCHISFLSNFLSYNPHYLQWNAHNFTSPNKIMPMNPLFNTKLYFWTKKWKTNKKYFKKIKQTSRVGSTMRTPPCGTNDEAHDGDVSSPHNSLSSFLPHESNTAYGLKPIPLYSPLSWAMSSINSITFKSSQNSLSKLFFDRPLPLLPSGMLILSHLLTGASTVVLFAWPNHLSVW